MKAAIWGRCQLLANSAAVLKELYGPPGKEPKLWGCLIHDRLADSQEESENWALVGTAFSTGWQGYTFWRLRWRVENNGFRELKEGSWRKHGGDDPNPLSLPECR